ncbi:MAG: phospho-sugar mutase [Chitinophagaceae bacterium]|nr:phospho-sugar mutase [Oligoflexus sp.]
MEEQVNKLATYWATSPVFDAKTRGEISALLEAKDDKELAERFYRDLEFGTGGLRGILGAGTARMNIYNVRKAAQAFADYLNSYFAKEPKSIAISYDSRRYSREFSEATAEVMAANGISAYITKELRPTPILSYMVRHYQCKGGVCVTASHNPAQYNGYKVYWETGGQIVPPHDEAIIKRYGEIKNYEDIKFMPFAEGVKKGLIKEVGAELDEAYYGELLKLSVRPKLGRDNFKIVYTPLHGTGGKIVPEALKRFGFKDVTIVPEQAEPNQDFPTVKFPNPEEPEAMEMAINLGKKLKADLVLGTDPDSDRIGIVVREGDEYRIFNGNQIGSLLIDFYLSGLKDSGRMPKNPLVIKTVVTTDQQVKIAQEYGATCEETLTGFKWICQLIDDIETGKNTPHRQYVCGGEESYGFLAGTFVRDKDAVSACCIAAEMVAYYKSQGKTLSQVLDELYLRHGAYLESLATFTLPGREGAARIATIMEQLRKAPPQQIAGSTVVKLRDLEKGQELTLATKQTSPIPLPSSNVLQFILSDGSKVSARPSGTEPKIKFYFSVYKELPTKAHHDELELAKASCAKRIGELEQAFKALIN